MAETKRNIKDSVFTYLFSQPEYAKQLYLTLHPEDADVSESDFSFVTIENVLTIGQYNDLGIQVRDKLILLVEAQSTFSENIPLRMLMYLANTYKEYVEEHKLSLYREKRVKIPRPELYVVYSGDNNDTPNTLTLSDMYGLPVASIEVTVKVLKNDGTRSIIDQYIDFCKVINAQIKLHGYTEEALTKTIEICLREGILAPFIKTRQKEVIDIMTILFDQEKIMEIERYNIAQENREEGRQEGRQEERENSIRTLVQTVQEYTRDKQAAIRKLIESYQLVPSVAAEKVELYWKQ